jgi:hypothetical protein
MRLAPLLALAPLAALAAACGGSSAGDPVAKAATASANAKAEHVHLDASIDANGSKVTMQGDGDFANDPVLGSMNLTTSVGGHDVTMSEVASGTKIYLASPLFKGQIPGGKTWLAVDYGKVAKAAGVSIVSAASQSPTDALRQLEASGNAHKVGEETLDGVHTTHWTATIDPKKLAKLEARTQAKLTYAPVGVWIDDEGRVRKAHISGTTSATAATPAVSTDMTMTFSDYGEDVHVTVPAASETFDATALAQSQVTTTTGGTP